MALGRRIDLDDETYVKFLNGVKLSFDEQDKIARVYNNNTFIGLGTITDGKLKRYIVQ